MSTEGVSGSGCCCHSAQQAGGETGMNNTLSEIEKVIGQDLDGNGATGSVTNSDAALGGLLGLLKQGQQAQSGQQKQGGGILDTILGLGKKVLGGAVNSLLGKADKFLGGLLGGGAGGLVGKAIGFVGKIF